MENALTSSFIPLFLKNINRIFKKIINPTKPNSLKISKKILCGYTPKLF